MIPNATTLADIQARDWSMMLDSSAPNPRAGAGLGNAVQALADIAQCIIIIVTTPKGSDPLRPDFATNIFSFIDRPITLMLPHLVREVVTAINRYEPRCTILSISAQPLADEQGAHVAVTITWRLNLQGAPAQAQQTIVTIPLTR